MTIKENNRVVNQSYLTYIAEDGREFLTEGDCIRYEKNLSFQEKEMAAEKIPHTTVCAGDIGIVNCYEDERVWVVKIDTKDELETINAYLRAIDGNYITEDNMHRNLILVIGDDYTDIIDAYYHIQRIIHNLDVAETELFHKKA